MLIKNHLTLEKGSKITLTKHIGGKETRLGAFPEGSDITFRVILQRRLGAAAIVLRIAKDGLGSEDMPFDYIETVGDSDVYEISLPSDLGLYFYDILLVRGSSTLFLSSVNNLDFELKDKSERSFSLLFYNKEFKTPKWIKGGTMYHIFVDRFYRGKGEVALHGQLNEDWENGIPQFAEKNGDPLSNDIFFGGNLWGVIEKLDYLEALGVNIIYLSPIFSAASNHRYDTADYETVDKMLGGDKAFDALIKAAHKKGIRVILDGVFNHTGDDSKYFDRKGTFGGVGAYSSEKSPYHPWFNFTDFPDSYESWWGIDIMPRLQHSNPDCRHYFTAEGGIIEKWLKRGADGWRLDVADELSDAFLDELNETAKRTKDAFVVGEVWENAVTKTAYSYRRRYFWGGQLDSVMNYPLKNAILALLIYKDSEAFYNTVTELYSSYPKPVLDCLMNIISTHDTERITTLLGDPSGGSGKSNRELSTARLSEKDRTKALKLLKLASVIQFTVFGIPSVYYGDETGLEGYHDPFCRLPFPWHNTDKDMQEHYKMLGEMRRKYDCLKSGSFEFIYARDGVVAYRRESKKDALTVYINSTDNTFEAGNIKIAPNSYKII